MTISEVSKDLVISEWTIRGWIATGKIPVEREGGRVFIPRWIVEQLMRGDPIAREQDKVRRGRPSVLHRGLRIAKPIESTEGGGDSERPI